MALSQEAFEYDAWLIDLDGTLYSPTAVKLGMAMELLFAGPRNIKIIKQFRAEHDAVRGLETLREQSPFEEQLLRTSEALDLPRREVETIIRKWMIQKPRKWIHLFRRRGLLRDIEKFRRKNGLTAVVSDYPAEKKLRSMYAHMLFDEIVASGERGGPSKLKPSPEGLLDAARKLAVPPARCLVIGDRVDTDGEAAAAAGMKFQLIK